MLTVAELEEVITRQGAMVEMAGIAHRQVAQQVVAARVVLHYQVLLLQREFLWVAVVVVVSKTILLEVGVRMVEELF
jgi:hypothetical protein